MKSVSFRAELGINEGFDAQKNQNISIRISELCKQLQQLQKDVEDQTGIYIATVVSGPNRSIYKTEWDCPVGGEISYTIHSISDRRTDSRLQLKKDSWTAFYYVHTLKKMKKATNLLNLQLTGACWPLNTTIPLII